MLWGAGHTCLMNNVLNLREELFECGVYLKFVLGIYFLFLLAFYKFCCIEIIY